MPHPSHLSALFRRSPIPALAGGAVLLFAALFLLRSEGSGLRGDEGTYVAMAASLARDFDLGFTAPDRAWAEQHAGGPVALILERTGKGLAYSKPVLYPLLAAPFVGLFGDWGAALLNLVVLLLALALARAFLERRGERVAARDALLTFVATGIVVPYVAWRMIESLSFWNWACWASFRGMNSMGSPPEDTMRLVSPTIL